MKITRTSANETIVRYGQETLPPKYRPIVSQTPKMSAMVMSDQPYLSFASQVSGQKLNRISSVMPGNPMKVTTNTKQMLKSRVQTLARICLNF